MQNYTTIIGIIEMRSKKCTYDECQKRHSIGAGTVKLIMTRFDELGLSLEDLKQMDAEKVEAAFYPPDNSRRKKIPLPDYEKVYDRLVREGSKANLFFLWLKYKKDCPDGYQYTQFVHYFKKYLTLNHGSDKVSMVVERFPGEKIYIDWVGDQPELLVNPHTGEISKVHIFVTTVGVSNLIYAEIFMDEKLPQFITGTVHALDFYDAIPKYLVPDNLRAAVTKHTKDELIINSAYQDIEDFYDLIILPPPPRKPKGKPTVEKFVQYLETHLIEELKENVYTSLEAINTATQEIIVALNSRIPKGQAFSRMEAYLRYDKPQMRPLSGDSFSPCDYKYFPHIPNNCHLLYDDHYYSVLYTYYNQPAILKATMAEIRICDRNNKLLCTHRRSYKEFPRYITKDEHMKAEHRFYKEVNSKDGAYYRRWASAYGPYMSKLIDVILHTSRHEEQSYNSCNGILHMCSNQSKVLVEEAAKRCVDCNACRYSYFKKVLSDVINTHTESGVSIGQKLPEHKNIRGKEFYK